MNVTIDAIEPKIYIPYYMTAEEIKSVTIDDEHLSMVSEYVLCG